MQGEDSRVSNRPGSRGADQVLERGLDVGELGELNAIINFEDGLVGLLDLLAGVASGDNLVVAILAVSEGDAELVCVTCGDEPFVNETRVKRERQRVVVFRGVVEEANEVETLVVWLGRCDGRFERFAILA